MKKLKKIKDSFISRQIATGKLTLKTAKGYWDSRKSDSLKEVLQGTFQHNIDHIVNELDLMKGSLMKAGQMLSLFGGAFLPEELKVILKKLENQSSYLEWEQIKKQIPSAWEEELNLETKPLASASLGQVHKFVLDGKTYCMKIQYSGVRKAINNDIRVLKLLVKFFNKTKLELNFDEMFAEVKKMLLLEMDYTIEAENTKKFKSLLEEYEYFKVPEVLDEYSNSKILTTEFIDGVNLHDLDVINISQEDRNRLGREFMRLFFLEIFIFEKVQTDAHFGNYLIIQNPKPHWGLIDFGATKEPPKEFIRNYQKLIISLRDKTQQEFVDRLYAMGYLSSKQNSEMDLFWEYAQLIGSPFVDGEFDWGKTDIADRVFDFIPRIIKSVSVGSPPSDTIFLDRKLGGVFFILQKLKAKFNLNELLNEILELQIRNNGDKNE